WTRRERSTWPVTASSKSWMPRSTRYTQSRFRIRRRRWLFDRMGPCCWRHLPDRLYYLCEAPGGAGRPERTERRLRDQDGGGRGYGGVVGPRRRERNRRRLSDSVASRWGTRSGGIHRLTGFSRVGCGGIAGGREARLHRATGCRG